jgi:DNA-binding response OmpR family regulator
MKRRILLVDDELAILLTLKAVLEISGFDVETAASAREAKLKLRTHEYHMVITDMRMENETAGMEVVAVARKAPNKPAIAMLTAFPLPGSEGEDGADKLLVKPMNTGDLLVQLEALLVTHEDAKSKEARLGNAPTIPETRKVTEKSAQSSQTSAERKPTEKVVESKTLRKPSAPKLAQAR